MATRHSDSCCCWSRDSGSDAWDHFNTDPVPGKVAGLFGPPSKEVWVTTLEADHHLAGQGLLKQHFIDLLLIHCVLAGSFTHIDHLGIGGDMIQEPAPDQCVYDNDISLLQPLKTRNGDQSGVTGASAD